jgi:branched-chain amino acid transport system permease protein
MWRGDALSDVLRRVWPVLSLAVALVMIAALVSLGPATLQRTVTEAFIRLVIVIGIYVFIGNSGVLSFGHVSFMAIGAYGSALLTIAPATKKIALKLPPAMAALVLPVVPAGIIAALVASLFAFLIGLPLMRLSGISASMGTFAALAIVFVVISNWKSVTGGQSALIGVPVYTNVWIALVYALLALVLAYAYQQSRFGLRLRASREDEVAAYAAGVNVRRERRIAFVFSAFIVAFGGVLHGHFLGLLSSGSFYLDITFITLAMLVIGGMNSLAGAVVGTVVVSTIGELLRLIESGFQVGGVHIGAPPGLKEVGLSLLMLLILIYRPQGITGGREIPWPVRRRAGAGG